MSKYSKYAAMLGRIKSPKKAAASRRNGKLGGRPRQPKVTVDADDFDVVSQHVWHVSSNGYARGYIWQNGKRELWVHAPLYFADPEGDVRGPQEFK